jgi:hypothetical protein
MNDLLTRHASPVITSNSDPMDSLGDLGSFEEHAKASGLSTSSIARRQNKFQKQRSVSSAGASDPEDTPQMAEERAKMGLVLPAGGGIGASYTCCVLTRMKRASQSINNNMNATQFDCGNTENDVHFDNEEWVLSTVDQRKRYAQDLLLFRELKAGLIPEQLLKKIPRMGALVSLDLSHFSMGDELCQCLGKR